ncbi:hypothetical protein [Daejeonella sp. JGW-45]|uniref:hypothetical protein n=1 Tax=Daejeonella sp. JGW-45 TaxID=3034148 RepID=UPI0023EB3AB7|nr:hypothetical protein [Daejeonella sp. JGW-45]
MPLKPIYFKLRGRFDFSPHPYEIGRPVFRNVALEDNFFLLKIYELNESKYSAFYQFQLEHFLKRNPGQEKAFFNHVEDIVINRIRHFKRQDPFSSNYAFNMECSRKLQAFQQFLATIDQWHQHKPLESVISEKDEQILELKAQIDALEAKLKDLQQYETSEKVRIVEGKLPTIIDLFRQLQELTLPDDRKLVRSQTQSPWYKMLAKYFNHGESEIPINTARNYFPAQKDVKLIKGSEVQQEDKLFKIVENKNSKK